MSFYALFHRSVYNSSYRILEHSGEAEEVMQETFLKVFTRPHLLKDDPGVMEATLRRIAINHSIDICRRRHVEYVQFDYKAERSAAGDAQPEVDEQVDNPRITIDIIKEKIKALPRKCRLVLDLHLIEGLDYDTIAGELGVAASAVRAQYSRARRRLMESIKEMEGIR